MASNALIARLEKSVAEFRSAPSNNDAETALLGALLVNNDAFYRVGDFLEAQHFHNEHHRRIFETMVALIKAGKVATPITLKTHLGDGDVGGIPMYQYLIRLAGEATTIINAEDYGRTIYDLAIRRNLIKIGEEMVNTAYDAPMESTPRDQIEVAEKKLYELAESGRYDGGFQTFNTALTAALDMAAKAYERDGQLSGVATGLHDLDRMMGGLQPSDLIIIAGRPAMGKTSLVTNIAFNVAKAYRGEKRPDGTTETVNGGIVGFFSCEMSAEQLATRIIAEQSGIPSYKIRRGDIREDEFHRVSDAVREMQTVPFYIDQTGGLSIAGLTARARRLKRQRGLDLLVVDYLQLPVGLVEEGREPGAGAHRDHHGPEGLGQGALGALIALSQLSRQVESATTSAPSSRTCANRAPSSRTPTW
jgi:replicative DNA helicase